MSRFRVKRTPNAGPPAGLLFGELAYSDTDQQLYVGRDTEAEPTTFKADWSSLEADVEALETSQGTQDNAIATLTAASESQAVALAGLQEQPVSYGFTYDQQAEPSGPAAGAKWRERSSGGLILGEWEWSGAVWVDGVPRATQEIRSNLTATLTNAWLSLLIPRISRFSAILVENCIISWGTTDTPPVVWNALNYYSFLVAGRSNLVGAVGAVGPDFVGDNSGVTATETAGRSFIVTIPINTIYSLPSNNSAFQSIVRFRCDVVKTGEAPNLVTPMATINYRGLR